MTKFFTNTLFFKLNNKLSLLYFILIIAVGFSACRGRVKGDNKNDPSTGAVSLHAGNEKYIPVDTKESVVTWKGSMQIGTNSHTGYVYISKGELMMESGRVIGGTVEVDMNTIEDDHHGKDNNLINHLKDADFFDVKKFPIAAIAITKVSITNDENKEVTGNLTIKGITNPVSFPARIEVGNGYVNANGRLVIDRTKWDVRYKSGKFYDLLADQVMSDSIAFDIKIVAKK